MSIYIELFHGRRTVDEELDNWGFEGPVIGPFPFFHLTYGFHAKMEKEELVIGENDLVLYKGAFYEDLSVFSKDILSKEPNMKQRWEKAQEVFKTPDARLPLLLNSEQPEWVKIYVEKKLKGAKPHHTTNKKD